MFGWSWRITDMVVFYTKLSYNLLLKILYSYNVLMKYLCSEIGICLWTPTKFASRLSVIVRFGFQLTEKQYVWTALRARANLKRWNDVEGLFTTKVLLES